MAQGFTQELSHPHFTPVSIADNKFRRHHHSLVMIPLHHPDNHYYLLPPILMTHYPPRENSSVLCVRIYAHMYICVYVCACVCTSYTFYISTAVGYPIPNVSLSIACSRSDPKHQYLYPPTIAMSTKLNRMWQQQQ